MQIRDYLKQLTRKSLIALMLLLSPTMANSAELLMIEEPGCVYCARFNREIGSAYQNTDEGKSAPLRRLQLTDPWPDTLANVRKPTVTPTFILIEDGQEVDRLVGYPGDEHFWFLLTEMLSKL